MSTETKDKSNNDPSTQKLIKRRIFILAIIIDIIAVICIACIFIIRPILSRNEQKKISENSTRYAVIYQNGREMMRIDLDNARDNSFVIAGNKGASNTITIKDHDIYFSDASCPHKLCVKQGSATKSHIPVICLPNKLMILIENTTEGGEYDAIAY